MSFDDSARLIWSLAASGLGTALATSGNSGPYTATPAPGVGRTAVDLRRVGDVWLSVVAAGGSGTALTVLLNAYDDLGSLLGGNTGLLPVTLASAPGSAVAFAGRHGATSTSYVVLPEWGQISWALTGTMTGCEIALYGR